MCNDDQYQQKMFEETKKYNDDYERTEYESDCDLFDHRMWLKNFSSNQSKRNHSPLSIDDKKFTWSKSLNKNQSRST